MVMELGSAFDRCRVAVGGTIVEVGSSAPDGALPPGFRCVLCDGTGEVDLFFLGRSGVPGLGVGARCHVDGTARMEHGRLTVWNPLYRLEPTEGDLDD
jgi:hypothetical protein